MPPGTAKWLCAGRITGAYGIKGWVKVHSYTDPASNLLDYEAWGLAATGSAELGREQAPAGLRQVKPLAGRMQGKALVAQLPGVADRTAAEALRGTGIWLPADSLPALEAGDYYWRDLVGLKVITDFEGRSLLLGEVDHLLETGANDVLVLRPCAGSIDDRQRLLPYLPESVVREVDQAAGEMRVHWHPED
jgi:16S rRNA processing protein RimM